MCVSVSPADFSKTRVYAGEAIKDGKLVHVVDYQNVARSLVGGSARRVFNWVGPSAQSPQDTTSTGIHADGSGGNAMLLHFPAVPSTMSQANVVDTEWMDGILSDMVDAALGPHVAVLAAIEEPVITWAHVVEVFESGIYTVVLAQNATDIPDALGQVPAQKRPALNRPLFDAYAEWYPDWPVALCCFNNADAQKATPMLWWYEPRDPNTLIAPALDCHTGDVPDLDANVEVDHWVIFSVLDMPKTNRVYYTNELSHEARSILPEYVIGKQYSGYFPNGDFVAYKDQLRSDKLRVDRVSPKGMVFQFPY